MRRAVTTTLSGDLLLHTSSGNHEGCSDTVWQGNDSGGECGVPFDYRFSQPVGDGFSKPMSPLALKPM